MPQGGNKRATLATAGIFGKIINVVALAATTRAGVGRRRRLSLETSDCCYEDKPMSLSADDVRRIAELAMLAIDERRIPDYAKDLSHCLALLEQLGIDGGVEPMSHSLDMRQRLRADEVCETDQRELFRGLAPAVQDGLYLVPRVID